MLNLVKMNYYRMVRTKMTWVLLVITLLYAGISTIQQKAFFDMINTTSQNVEILEETTNDKVVVTDDGVEMNFGVSSYLPVNEDGSPATLMQYVVEDLQGGGFLIFISIFTGVFASAEMSSGFIKNVGKLKKRKSMAVLAKLVTVMGYTLLLFSAYSIIKLISLEIVFSNLTLGITLKQCSFIAVQYILVVAYGAGVLFLTTITRSSSIPVSVGIVLATGVGYMITTLITYKVNLGSVDLNSYLLVGTINNLSSTSSQATFMKALFVGLGWFFAYTGASVFITEKRDII